VISENELRDLAGFVSTGSPAISLYMDTDLTQQLKEKCKLVLRDLLESVSESASDEDLARVERFFDLEYDWQARGIAIFSAADQGFWRQYPLTVPIESEMHTGARLHLRPMTELLAEYEPYAVLLVDRESARFLLASLGQIEETSEWIGQDLKRHKQGGFAAPRFQRHVDKQAEQNLKTTAEATTRFCQEHHCQGLVLGGADETLSQFQEMLPKALRKQIVGTLPFDMTASPTEVHERSAALIEAHKHERQLKLVDDLVTAAAKGGDAVTGLADTFYVAYQGRAHTLVVEQGFEVDGYLCSECDYVSADPIDKCPLCGGKPQRIQDAVNRVIHQVIAAGGKVETVADSEGLAVAGHIGAVLRY
jgi:peptide subunit release factor 1 (eRF1)